MIYYVTLEYLHYRIEVKNALRALMPIAQTFYCLRREIQRVEDLEEETGQTMFRPKRYKTRMYPNGCHGIREVIQWAHKAPLQLDEPKGYSQCATGYCGI